MAEIKERQSNFELLRIISMLMVLAVHLDGASLGLPDFAAGTAVLNERTLWQTLVESVSIIGVNSFTLISGWFGIRFSVRGMLGFMFQCLFYAVLVATVALSCGWISWGEWLERWLVLTHTDLWYVPAYFCLMLLAPFINAGFEKLGGREVSVLLTLFVAFNLWGGWWCQGRFNPTGYTVVQLVLVYMIGRWMSLHGSSAYGRLTSRVQNVTVSMLAIYVVAVAGIVVSALVLPPQKAYAYNSPAVLLCTVALFMLFKKMEIRSRFINRAAQSAFAVYLLHKSPEGWLRLTRPLTVYCWQQLPLWGFTLYVLLFILSVYAVAMLIDPLRRRLWRRCLNSYNYK